MKKKWKFAKSKMEARGGVPFFLPLFVLPLFFLPLFFNY